LKEGGRTGSDGRDTTEETKARLLRANDNLEAANKILKDAIKPLAGL
jgi:hypothetical protein